MRLIYFTSNFIPVILALVIIWNKTFIFRKRDPTLSKALPVLLSLAALGLINALAESKGLSWGIWSYNDPHTLGISFFGVVFETYLYCILVPLAIGSAAIKFAERQDNRAKRK